jgi:phage terminase large subunit-like protein
VRNLNRDWLSWARNGQQVPPPGEGWRCWLILGGRGAGKTRTGAEWVRALATGLWEPAFPRARRIAIVAPTHAQARQVMIEGESGLLSLHPEDERPHYEPSKRLLTWPNGSIAQIFSAEDPEGLRGPQFDAAWCDELAKWPAGEACWHNLALALRLGTRPCAVVTTTPRPVPLLKKLLADEATAVSRSRTRDNAGNLAPSFLKDVTDRYGGTRLGRQELDGEIIEDDPAALFRRVMIERARCIPAPDMERIVVAVDPPAGEGPGADACGIICAGIDAQGQAYVLADATVQGLSPRKWARRVNETFETWKADRIVAEVNQGGAMVAEVLQSCGHNLPIRAVHATRGKRARAEPVAALYEQGKVHHAGVFPELEDEMCQAPEQGRSPDRLDALVWALTDLMLRRPKGPRVHVM